MIYTKEQILHAEELRNERIGLHKEHDRLSGEGRVAKGSRKSSLTRKMNKVHARILELNSILRDAPQSPLEPDEAIREIVIIIEGMQSAYDSNKTEFVRHCADFHPEYAIRYFLEDMMIAKAKVDFFRYISETLQSDPVSLDEIEKVVHDTRERIMDEHVLNIDSPSTSRESNLLDEYKYEAAVKLLQKRMSSTNVFDQIDNIFAGIEMWRILQK